MADKEEELEKLFEAAIYGKKAPSRFGTPEDQVIQAPVAFQRATADFQKAGDAQNPSQPSPFQASPFQASPFQASPFQAAPAENVTTPEVILDEKSVAALDENVNSEFESIIDKKIAKEKGKKRRDRMFAYVALIAIVVGAGGWLYMNPDKRESIGKILVELRTAIDPTVQAARYDESLEKIGEHGNTLNDASAMLGVKPGDEGSDGSLDEEVQKMAGGDAAGLSSEEKKKKLDALKSKVPIKKKDEGEKTDGKQK
jgi:hypothetical protein